MNALQTELEQKKQELQALKENQSKSFCVAEHTSGNYMKFMMKIEDLEDEIEELEERAGKE